MNAGLGLLAASVLCSVTVAILLKLARRYDIDVRQAIATNYAMAALLCVSLLKPDLARINVQGSNLLLLGALGVLMPSVFVAMARSVRYAGIVRSDAAQRLSLFIALLAAFVLFGEPVTGTKLAGIALAFAALFCVLRRPADAPAHDGPPQAAWMWPLAVWAGYGTIDVLFKVMARSGSAFSGTLLLVFLLAGVLMTLYLLLARTRWQARSLAAGLLLGLMNFANIYTYIRAHQTLPDHPALVFASMNMGVIALGTLAGAVLFREKLSAVNLVGLALALGAIVVMMPR
ncbi:EamA family transporter [Pseudomonadota bacterium AL_CKDN230030165-1A_HGKHYDSX7]